MENNKNEFLKTPQYLKSCNKQQRKGGNCSKSTYFTANNISWPFTQDTGNRQIRKWTKGNLGRIL